MHLTINEAKTFVRARLDELSQTSSDMLLDSVDDRNLGRTVEEMLPEAITAVHLAAPASLIDNADEYTEGSSANITYSVTDKILDIAFTSGGDTNILRFVSFKCSDGIRISRVFEEDSPEARMQNDPFIRGMADEPVIVRIGDSTLNHPHYKYYTTESPTADVSFSLYALSVPVVTERTEAQGGDYYEVSSRLKYETLNYLTAMVLIAYGQGDKAHFFFTKASL